MSEIDEQIRGKAMLRLCRIFGLPLEALARERRFGEDLRASFVSDFRRNELDRINDDIHDVADRSIAKELASGKLMIRTVGDYGDHMVRCSKTRPKEVQKLLNGTDDQGQSSA
jgi:hypothetical protein